MNAESGIGANGGRFPKITDRDLEDLQKRIGVRIENMPEPWCCEATRDNIRHYAHGIGDDNPLWCDPAYAEKTKHGSLVALPSSRNSAITRARFSGGSGASSASRRSAIRHRSASKPCAIESAAVGASAFFAIFASGPSTGMGVPVILCAALRAFGHARSDCG